MGIVRNVVFLSLSLFLGVMTLPAYGAYDASVITGQTVTLQCNSASDSDCKIVDGDGTPETDYGFTYSWTAEWVGGGAAGTFPSGNEGRSVTWIAPPTGGDVEITVTADSGSDKYADTGEDTWIVRVRPAVTVTILNSSTLLEQPWDTPLEPYSNLVFRIDLETGIQDISDFPGTIQAGSSLYSTDNSLIWTAIELDGDDTLSNGGETITVTVPYSELLAKNLVASPSQAIGTEYLSVEKGSANFNDSDQFEGEMSGPLSYKRISARDNGNWTGESVTNPRGTIKPWTAPSSDAYVCAGGAIRISVYVELGSEAAVDHGMYSKPAAVLYLSTHGLHLPGTIGNSISSEDVDWQWVDTVIIAGCSVLDIGDFNGNFPDESPPSNPGLGWATTGPFELMGYNAAAPSDDRQAGLLTALIVSQFFDHLDAEMDTLYSWGLANKDLAGGPLDSPWNACAIDSVTETYWYWDQTIPGFYTWDSYNY